MAVLVNFALDTHDNGVVTIILDAETVEGEQELVAPSAVGGENLLARGEGILISRRHTEICLRVIVAPPAKVFLLSLYLFCVNCLLLFSNDCSLNVAHLLDKFSLFFWNFELVALLLDHLGGIYSLTFFNFSLLLLFLGLLVIIFVLLLLVIILIGCSLLTFRRNLASCLGAIIVVFPAVCGVVALLLPYFSTNDLVFVTEH